MDHYYKKLDTLENVDSFKSWALRIIYSKAIDTVNQRNRARKNLTLARIIDYDSQSIEEESKHIQMALLSAIQKLPKEKQDIIRLFYAESYTIIEISNFLKIPIGTVKSRLFKAREKIKINIKKNKT